MARPFFDEVQARTAVGEQKMHNFNDRFIARIKAKIFGAADEGARMYEHEVGDMSKELMIFLLDTLRSHKDMHGFDIAGEPGTPEKAGQVVFKWPRGN